MSELADEQNESHVQHGVVANASIRHDPLAHMNGGRAPHPDPVGYMEENADHIIEFDEPVYFVGHDRGLRYFFKKA